MNGVIKSMEVCFSLDDWQDNRGEILASYTTEYPSTLCDVVLSTLPGQPVFGELDHNELGPVIRECMLLLNKKSTLHSNGFLAFYELLLAARKYRCGVFWGPVNEPTSRSRVSP